MVTNAVNVVKLDRNSVLNVGNTLLLELRRVQFVFFVRDPSI